MRVGIPITGLGGGGFIIRIIYGATWLKWDLGRGWLFSLVLVSGAASEGSEPFVSLYIPIWSDHWVQEGGP